MGEKTLFVSLTCSKAREATARICEVFESLKVKIITASVTTVSGMVKTTILIEVSLFFPPHLSIISLQGNIINVKQYETATKDACKWSYRTFDFME